MDIYEERIKQTHTLYAPVCRLDNCNAYPKWTNLQEETICNPKRQL